MSRICYFKQHGASGLALAADVTTLQGVVNGKADASAVYSKTDADALLSSKLEAADIASKANSADVYTAVQTDKLLSVKLVAADISGKADSSYLQEVLDGVNDALGNRAQVNAVYSITAMDTLLGDKADASALASKLDSSIHDARVTAENAFFLAMSESLYVESAPASGTEFSYAGLIGV